MATSQVFDIEDGYPDQTQRTVIDDKTYEVNLVKINTKKDSLDFFKLKNAKNELGLHYKSNYFYSAKKYYKSTLIRIVITIPLCYN